MPSIPTAQFGTPSPSIGRRISAFPQLTPASLEQTVLQSWAVNGAAVAKFQIKTMWSWNHLATLALPLVACPRFSWGCGDATCD
jgi:hypothetical protein